MTYTGTERVDAFFKHHGIKGQKWGIRRFQNEDGSLTEEGQKRYGHDYDKKGNLKSSAKKDDDKLINDMKKVYELHRRSKVEGRRASNRLVELAGKNDKKTASVAEDKKLNKHVNKMEKYGEKREKELEKIMTDYITKHGTLRLDDILDLAAYKSSAIGRVENKYLNDMFDNYNNYVKEISHRTEERAEQMLKEKSLSHSGIKGMHWYQRRFQNPDGSLTPEGRKRYLKGGEKQIKKLEKERARKEAILSDRKKLYKHRNEFTTDEINKAMEKFTAQDKLKAQMEEGKQARLQAKADANKMKLELKRIKAQTKLEKIKSEEQEKQQKLSTQQQKLTTEGKQQTADTANKAEQWKNRVNKAKSIWEFAQVGQSILSDMGITSKDGSDSLLGALAESMGIKDTSAKKAEAAAKKAREIEKETVGLKKAKADMAKVIVDTYGSGQTKLSKAEVDAILEGLGLISRSS